MSALLPTTKADSIKLCSARITNFAISVTGWGHFHLGGSVAASRHTRPPAMGPLPCFVFDTPSVLRFNLAMERPVDDLKDPSCPECGCIMWLKLIEQNKPGHDERTFECPRCLYSESFVVELN